MDKILFWGITGKCNLNCTYCFNKFQKKFVKDLCFDDNETIIRAVIKYFDMVVFTGGDPLLYDKILTLIEKLKSHNLKVQIVTNGLNLTKSNIIELLKMHIDCIAISLDSLKFEINDYLRGQTKHTLNSLNQLLTYRKKPLNIRLLQTVTKINIKCIKELNLFCKNEGIIHSIHPIAINKNHKNYQVLSLTTCNEYEESLLTNQLLMWANGNKSLTHYVNAILNLIKGKKNIIGTCLMGKSKFFLDNNNRFFRCFRHRTNSIGKIENVLEKPLTIKNNNDFNDCVSLKCIPLWNFPHY